MQKAALSKGILRLDKNPFVPVLLLGAFFLIAYVYWYLLHGNNRLCMSEYAANRTTTSEGDPVSSHKSYLEGTSGALVELERKRQFPKRLLKFKGGNTLRIASNGTAPSSFQVHKNLSCDRRYWAVVTTIFAPAEAVRSTLGENLIFLNEEDQVKIGSDFVDALPWQHFGRKNIGYLYAIANGASVIWDFDDDNMLKFWLRGASVRKEADFWTYLPENVGDAIASHVPQLERETILFNPYPSLGCDQRPCWPRGFPLSRLHDVDPSYPSRYRQETLATSQIGVLQSLADAQPDVDAVFRFTRETPMNFHLDVSPYEDIVKNPAPISVPQGVYAPLNAQATIWYRSAFFALYLPVTVHGRVSDIWRSYFANALFQIIDLRILFLPRPIVVQDRNEHNIQGDFNSELPLYTSAEALVRYLSQWVADYSASSREASFEELIERLWIEMYEREVLEMDDVLNMQKWMIALASVGYEFPRLGKKQAHHAHAVSPVGDYSLAKSVLNTELTQIQPDNCKKVPTKTIFTSDLHDGTRADQPLILASLGQRILSGSRKRKHDPHHVFLNNPRHFLLAVSEVLEQYDSMLSPLNASQIEQNLAFYESLPAFQSVDAFLCQFPAAMCQLWMSTEKSIMMVAAHRYNLGRCSVHSWNTLTAQIVQLAQDPKNLIAGLSRYDREYLKYYTGLGDDKVRILGSYSGQYTGAKPYEVGKPEILLVRGEQAKKYAELINSVKKFELVPLHDLYTNFKFSDLVGHRGIVYFPYSVMSYKMTEFYALGIPLFVPSPRLLRETGGLGPDRASTSSYYCGSKTADDLAHKVPPGPSQTHPFNPNVEFAEDPEAEMYWLQFADFYEWPHITLFDNATDLEDKLMAANFKERS